MNEPARKYRVCVDDNFHYMDEDERTDHGVFDTLEEAVAACKKIVDDSLAWNYKPGMTPSELYKAYTDFGSDPFIMDVDSASVFSAWTYAKGKCAEVCGKQTEP